ncbi:MAG: cobyrinate a,c-diamide synthase [Deltaproteobacteria bacterium]|nr:cobyrinate a,c-diamide synthase [Deltaproteobacteria bacterium]MBW2128420.1 cobyrinate a,c-diamide synthase [Deltaproteobacteria bacterium]MBW2303891.1 cobyrinate a,c-diamide synthase [Deltaproteobacteria bacterium]
MLNAPPRMIISALKGGSGKTVLSLGLASAWKAQGFRIAPFKKGPDFIDAAWLSLAAGRPCRNLDSFMMNDEQNLHSFLTYSLDADLALIEGNRGLFDGLDQEGCCSTAELARLLKCPVFLVADVTMSTRTVAALVHGCQTFEKDLRIAGVILNRVAGQRQESIIRASIEHYCGIPIVGSIPKLKDNPFPERHMGLVPHQERDHAEGAIAWARSTVESYLDLKAIWELAHDVPPISPGPDLSEVSKGKGTPVKRQDRPRIGYILDRSFWFYYPENLEHLERLGAFLVKVDATSQRALPELDALYIGGGFPETQASVLADNRSFRETLGRRIDEGLPVYAECGGLLFLGKHLVTDGHTYPMVGALSLSFAMEKRPQGHGYTILEVTEKNPYFDTGEVLRGHEFHYSRPLGEPSGDTRSVFRVLRGKGLDGRKDGLCRKNLLATYTHLHAAGNSMWGETLFQIAKTYKERREGRDSGNKMKD